MRQFEVFRTMIAAALIGITSCSSGCSVASLGMPSEVRTAVEQDAHFHGQHYKIEQVIDVSSHYYLAAIRMGSGLSDRLYVWIDKATKEVKPAARTPYKPVFDRFEDDCAWFLCSEYGEAFPAFPYYQVIRVGEDTVLREEPCFVEPRDASYDVSIAGHGWTYELTHVVTEADSIQFAFKVTSVGPGGIRPPRLRITEMASKVSLLFEDLSSSPSVLDNVWAFQNPYARVERIQAHSGILNIILSVEGRYSVKLIRRGETDPSDRPEQYEILFLPCLNRGLRTLRAGRLSRQAKAADFRRSTRRLTLLEPHVNGRRSWVPGTQQSLHRCIETWMFP